MHEVLPYVSEYVPAGQAEQFKEEFPPVEGFAVPAEQLVQDAAPDPLYVPLAHCVKHVDFPVPLLKYPAEQLIQFSSVATPGCGAYVPTGQL